MKRTYRRPAVETRGIETKATCLVAAWNVRDEKGDIYDPSTDHGYIIEDNGEGNNGEYDPWKSDNW